MYDPSNHYWRRDDGLIFSSARRKIMDPADVDYSLWLGAGGVATAWPRNENGDQTDKSLQEVLTQQGLFMDGPAGLSAMKEHLKSEIDRQAEIERLKYITSGAGQAMTYQEKFSELVAYEGDSNPTKEKYPMMAAEIGITAASLSGVASTIRAAYDLWKKIGSGIEVARLTAKSNIDKAASEKEARAAAEIIWPLPD